MKRKANLINQALKSWGNAEEIKPSAPKPTSIAVRGTCDQCGQYFMLWLGETGKCPRCGRLFAAARTPNGNKLKRVEEQS